MPSLSLPCAMHRMTSSGRRARRHGLAEALAPAVLFVLGLLTSIAVAGCGGGEGAAQVAGNLSTATRGTTLSRPEPTQTVERPTRSTVTTSTTVVVSTTPAPVTTRVLSPTTTAVTAVVVAPTTTNGEGSETGTPAWVWIVVGLGAGGVIARVVWLIHRNRGPRPAF